MGGGDRAERGRRRGGLIRARGKQDVARETSARGAPSGRRKKKEKEKGISDSPLRFWKITERSFSNKNSKRNLVFRAFLQTENLAKIIFGILMKFQIGRAHV